MAGQPDWIERARRREDAERRTRGLGAIALVLVLLVLSLLLTQTLRQSSAVEDCLLAGRINCDRVARGR